MRVELENALPQNIGAQSIISISPGHVFSNLGDEAVILDLNQGIYYGLDEVGAFVWGLIQQPTTVMQIVAAMLEAYDVGADECMRDVVELLGALAEAGLIEARYEEHS